MPSVRTNKKLIAVILAGGSSSRMGSAKGLLRWKGKPYLIYLKELLETFQLPVFLSCQTGQFPELENTFTCLHDRPEYALAGPMTGLLSAWNSHPDSDILLLGCDQFALDEAHLKLLMEASSATENNCSLVNPESLFTEPFPAVYRHVYNEELKTRYSLGQRSLLKFLDAYPLTKIKAKTPDILKSYDTPEDLN